MEEEYHETTAWEEEQNRQTEISEENEIYRKEYGYKDENF